MADAVHEYDELVRRIEQLETPRALPAQPGARVDICAVWKIAKPVVETGIRILRLLPFGWAKKLADVLQVLDDALNALCP